MRQARIQDFSVTGDQPGVPSGADDRLGEVVAGSGDLAAGPDQFAGAERACTPSTLWRVTPYFTARIPPALVGPRCRRGSPTVRRGIPGTPNPCSAVTVSRSARVTPGWTTATWLPVSIFQGRRHLLEGDEQSVGVGAGGSTGSVPEPRAVTDPAADAAASNSATCSAVCGLATYRGVTGSRPARPSWA